MKSNNNFRDKYKTLRDIGLKEVNYSKQENNPY
jgi:hypothetical protein